MFETVKKNGKVIAGVVAGLAIAGFSLFKGMKSGDEDYCDDDEMTEEEYEDMSSDEESPEETSDEE